MKAEKSIFEHGVHQRGLRAHGSEFDPRVEELFRKHAGVGCPIICGGPAGGHRLACWASVSGAMRGAHRVLLITNLSVATRGDGVLL
jgi:hypothetical protein